MPPKPPVTAEELTPRFGPYTFTGFKGPGRLAFADWGTRTGGDFQGDVTRALASERPASELRTAPPPRMDLLSLRDLFQRAGASPFESAMLMGAFMGNGGGDGPGGPGGPPGPSGVPSANAPTMGEMGLEGVTGGTLSPAVAGLLGSILGGVVAGPLGSLLGNIAGRAIGIRGPAPMGLQFSPPRGSSPAPTGAPPGLTAQDVDVATAAEQGEIGEPGIGVSATATGPTGDAPAPGVGDTGESAGDSGDSSAGDAGTGAGPGPGDAWHRGGPVTKGPPRGPERHGRLLEGEYVVRGKAVRLHKALLEAINRGASKDTLAKIAKAGR